MNKGRPTKYNTPEELQEVIDIYFDNHPDKPTLTGLAYELGFESRQSMYDYEKRSEDFSYTIKRARLRIEQHYEERLNTQYSSGAIFALKNMGWSDKRDIEFPEGIKIVYTNKTKNQNN